MAKFGIEEKLEDFATVFSFHPIDDVRDVRVYGNGPAREEAVVMIEADFDQEKLLALVRLNEHYEEIEYGDITLNRWLHEDGKSGESQMMYGCLCNAVQIHFESDSESLFQFLKEQEEKKRQQQNMKN